MTNDSAKIAPRDSWRVNLVEPHEVEYWCKRFSCTKMQLAIAVQKVGVMVKDIERKLKRP